MAIYRTKKDKENPYVMLNKFFLNDQRLSFKAKGLLAYLLSKPNDWVVMEKELVKASKDSRDSVRSGIKELIETGYIVRDQSRGTKGQFGHVEYDVYELPKAADKLKQKLPEDLLLESFQGIGATAEPTEGLRQETRRAIESGKKVIDAKVRWG